MRFNSSFSSDDINNMMYKEAEAWVLFFNEEEQRKILELSKMFRIYNFESTLIATHGKNRDFRKYMRDVQPEEITTEENDIEGQFKGLDFGE